MNVGDFLNELKRYEEEIDGIRSRFVRTSQEIHLAHWVAHLSCYC
jgi:hypothetical protein